MKDIAEGLGQSPGTITKTLARAGRRHREDGAFQAVHDCQDRGIAEWRERGQENNGGMAWLVPFGPLASSG